MFQCSQHLNHVDENVISSAKFLAYSELSSKLIVSAIHIQACVQRQSVLTWGRCKGGSPHTRSKQCTSRKRFISTARKISCFSLWSVLNLRQISAQGCQAKNFGFTFHIDIYIRLVDNWYLISNAKEISADSHMDRHGCLGWLESLHSLYRPHRC